MTHILDRPIWSALGSRHAGLAEGGALARRYDPGIVPFAAARDNSRESLDALAALAGPDEALVLLQADEAVPPSGFVVDLAAEGVQMLAERPPAPIADERVQRLGEHNAAEMLELATLTKPGPFSLKALSLGEFWGVRENGKLVAMAGERMKQDGFAELSGVCAHPDARGRGFARLVSVVVANRIMERGEQPYLHAFAANTAAIALYESIGFRLRRMMNVAMIRRPT
jgi:ribosomal protein S18 acetylase RimI-like enzyme